MNYQLIYELLLEKATEQKVSEVLIGRTWTMCTTEKQYGLAMSPEQPRRTLPWSGTLKGRRANELVNWITSWDPFEACVALSVINASTNFSTINSEQTTRIEKSSQANLSVFNYFLPRLLEKNVVVVGRYPGLENYEKHLNLTVLERNPGLNDLPDTASEYVIADADWVFLTASSIINKTFPRLAELATDTNLVLMGPSVPWLPELSEFGVDFLAGVDVAKPALLRQIVAEGGGVRIFDDAVNHMVMDLGQQEMNWHHTAISDLVSRRESLKTEMDSWYRSGKGSFPKKQELVNIDNELSRLDIQYKRLWDARHLSGTQSQNLQ